MKKLIIIICLLFIGSQQIFAQYSTINPAQIKRELDKRGLSQSEAETRLKERGIDINRIKPEDAPKMEGQIIQILDELEKEKKGKKSSVQVSDAPIEKKDRIDTKVETTNQRKDDLDVVNKTVDPKITGNAANVAKESAQEIKKAVKEGATVEEAIAEEIIDKDADVAPPASVYGANIFRNKSLKVYRNSDDAPALESYLLSAGDQVTVTIWGNSEFTGTFTVNKDGYITLDRMPRVYLKGLSFEKTKELLRKRFSNYYSFRPAEFAATITYKRTLTVNIYGEVFNPGAFNIPAINTAFNALVAAGGPSDIGTVRMIKLLRAGEKPRTIDVYEFMVNPAVQEKFYLEDNDIIQVPVSQRVVTIAGAVKKPFKFELINNENLVKLIEFAGGLNDNAYKNQLQVKRFINDKEVIIDVNYKSLIDANQDFPLLPGDVVQVKAIPRAYDNFAEISGAVDFPQKFEITTGMKIKDMVDKGIIQKEARTDYAYLQRTNTDNTSTYIRINLEKILSNPNSEENLIVNPKDKVIVYSKSIFSDRYNFSVSGSVRRPNSFPYDISKTLKVEDAVLLAGGLKPDATDFAYIVRRNLDNGNEIQYIRIDLLDVMKNPNSKDNIVIKPVDELRILSKISFIDKANIKVMGAVRNEGVYEYDYSLSLKDALTLAGGLKMEASASRIEISRVIIKDDKPTQTVITQVTVDKDLNALNGSANDGLRLMPYDQVIVRAVPEFTFQKNVNFSGEVKYPGTYAIIQRNETVVDVINRAGGLTLESFVEGATLFRSDGNVGYLVIKLDEAIKDPKSPFNYILKEGDILTIPKMKDFVTLRGAIRSNELYTTDVLAAGKLNVPYTVNKRALYYVNKYAAGVSKDGNRADITILHPNGELGRTKDFFFFKIYPKVRKGDIVSVGYKPAKAGKLDRDGKPREDIDWAKTTEKALASVTGILSLILLIRAVNP